jgi:hypothetical protein
VRDFARTSKPVVETTDMGRFVEMKKPVETGLQQ